MQTAQELIRPKTFLLRTVKARARSCETYHFDRAVWLRFRLVSVGSCKEQLPNFWILLEASILVVPAAIDSLMVGDELERENTC